jgi:AraC-like DNA-binding protein
VRNEPEFLGEVTEAPYVFFWDVKNVPDQGIYALVIKAEAMTNGGSLLRDVVQKSIVLDRNPAFSTKTAAALYTDKKIRIDGRLNDPAWAQAPSIKIAQEDNRAEIKVLWNGRFLYFGITVEDQYLVSLPERIPTVAPNDYLIGYLDLGYERSGLRDANDFDFFFSPNGHFIFEKAIKKGKIYDDSIITHDSLANGYYLQGTLNDSKDIDTGYGFELQIPWSAVMTSPLRNMKIGLEFVLYDQEGKEQKRTAASWAGTNRANMQNPSEWGTLILTRSASRAFQVLKAVIALILAIIGLYFIRKLKKPLKTPSPGPSQLNRVIQFIEQNYNDNTLNLDKISKSLGLGKSYISQLFKEELKTSYPEYLAQFRLKRAVTLLNQSGRNLTEIAFEVGFGSLDYFSKMFKTAYGMTPKEYRAKKSQ